MSTPNLAKDYFRAASIRTTQRRKNKQTARFKFQSYHATCTMAEVNHTSFLFITPQNTRQTIGISHNISRLAAAMQASGIRHKCIANHAETDTQQQHRIKTGYFSAKRKAHNKLILLEK
ncbi:hypothetical protein [Methylomonas sp. ZR1]|uniref:hypothetical protein n=1 Tax=Methylomonas sp. ZR1 TaxID=1797072 RepID=UPI0014910CEF|nr:hypothetical protein [Methylomonas sp. ZR1]